MAPKPSNSLLSQSSSTFHDKEPTKRFFGFPSPLVAAGFSVLAFLTEGAGSASALRFLESDSPDSESEESEPDEESESESESESEESDEAAFLFLGFSSDSESDESESESESESEEEDWEGSFRINAKTMHNKLQTYLFSLLCNLLLGSGSSSLAGSRRGSLLSSRLLILRLGRVGVGVGVGAVLLPGGGILH